MNTFQKATLLLLRLSLGWMFFWAGITKVMDPTWSAGGYIAGAKNFSDFFHFVSSSSMLPITNLANEWGLTLLGVALILGIFVRLGAVLGSILMLLYYLVILDFPYPNPHSYLVDEHIIYIFALLALGASHAGRIWGLHGWCERKLPTLTKLFF